LFGTQERELIQELAIGHIVTVRICLLTESWLLVIIKLNTATKAMATLERPVAADLENKICQLLQGQDPPDTLEAILDKLRETEFVYKHEIARSVWRLANEGRIAVESGWIKARP
jgi:hypothetical protein